MSEDQSAEPTPQQQASAQVAAAFAAAAGAPAPSALNVPVPANDASIEAMLSQKMPKHLMDRTLPPSMPPGAGGANQHHPVAGKQCLADTEDRDDELVIVRLI